MHENLQKIVNENMFSFTFLCKFFYYDEGQLYTANFLYGFNPFKMAVQFF